MPLIRQTKSKGRGLFVTKQVQAGDLLLVEKGLAYAHVAEGAGSVNETGSKTSLLINPGTGQAFMGAPEDLIKLTVLKSPVATPTSRLVDKIVPYLTD